jgi:DNA-binding response OmpR family regulator
MSDKPKVLIVDDDPDLRQSLRLLLEHRGFSVGLAAGGEAALKALDDQYDIVLTDFHMPGMDGFELFTEIKERYPALPVVMVTAYSQPEVILHALRSGVNDFIPKPYQSTELVAILTREIARSKAGQSEQDGQSSILPIAIVTPAEQEFQLSALQHNELGSIMSQLRAEAQAYAVVLIDRAGQVISAKGLLNDIDLTTLAAIVSQNLRSATRVASVIGDPEPARISYQEGGRYNIYALYLDAGAYLMLVFGKGVKSGVVMFAARQELPSLERILTKARVAPLPPVPVAPEGQFLSLDDLAAEDVGDKQDLYAVLQRLKAFLS